MIFGISYIIIGSISLLGGYSYFNRIICQNNETDTDNDNDNDENNKLTTNNNNYNTITDIIKEDVEEVKTINTNKITPSTKLKYSNIVTKHTYNSYWT